MIGNYVKLNVGGSLFYTTIGTLTRGSSMLNAMFSGRMEVMTDEQGWVLIDRSGKHFGTILNYLRDGSVPLPDARLELEELAAEARFFCVDGLITACETALSRLAPSGVDVSVFPRASIVIVKYPKAAKALLLSTQKPIVKLTMNRYNNVFSYTSNSHDNLLRNIECLEKYALMFSDTVLFVKDVRDKSEQNEICNWSYYCRAHKLKSIDCIAIHYSSEKRLIKVEFPESRIHEEMLFLLSVANRCPTDEELIEIAQEKGGPQMTSSSAVNPMQPAGNTSFGLAAAVSMPATITEERDESEVDQSSVYNATLVSYNSVQSGSMPPRMQASPSPVLNVTQNRNLPDTVQHSRQQASPSQQISAFRQLISPSSAHSSQRDGANNNFCRPNNQCIAP